jgi:hypothetical protein
MCSPMDMIVTMQGYKKIHKNAIGGNLRLLPAELLLGGRATRSVCVLSVETVGVRVDMTRTPSGGWVGRVGRV